MNVWWIVTGLIVLALGLVSLDWLQKKQKILIFSWGDLQENSILIELINDFRKKFPAIQVHFQRFPFGEYIPKVLESVQQGSGPDLVCMEDAFFTDFYFKDLLEPVTPYMRSAGLDRGIYYPQLVERFSVQHEMYAVPRDIAPICLIYYNQNAFDEAGVPYPKPGWNWDQFVQTAKNVMKFNASGSVARWGFADSWAIIDAWVYDAGGGYVDNINQPTRWTFVENPNTAMALQFRRDMIHLHKILPPPSVLSGANDLEGVNLFTMGSAAMFLCGLWKTPLFRDVCSFKWDVALLPKSPSGQLGFGMSSASYGILKSSAQKKAAWKFIDFAAGEAGARRFAESGLAQPALKKISESPYFLDGKDPRNKKILLEAVKFGKFSAFCKNWTEVKLLIEKELDGVWKGSESVEEALKRLRPILERKPPLAH